MNAYSYKARSSGGTVVEGLLEANTRDEAVDRLRTEGLIVTSIRETGDTAHDINLSLGGRKTKEKAKIVQEFETGDMLCHPKFGVGMLIEQDDKTMTVMFDEVGQKKLGKGFVKMEKVD